MEKVITISEELYRRLEKHVAGFGDSPQSVIERILDFYEGKNLPTERLFSGPDMGDRDFSKFDFKGNAYGKGRLVLAIVKDYVQNHPGLNFGDLSEIFPKHLQGSHGVFNKESIANDIYQRTGHKRYYIKPEELIQLSDERIAVCSQWGKTNIYKLLRHVESLGYEIKAQE
ncbi:hypothetical protein [Desulfofustis glycolicus]|uniref:Uncharacterized protein n=1 Tax=Desulfofustis glycolicus DSM 9705 TaxID=1121409 RepID=A0A1M5YWE1_9BACT|nr:hypothetical protein [Desulfofustis glycolicus]SHI16351.1 hypothetical protein SAMN02745124_04516 [Desulfofustis glycolicus DSM 9705]